MHTCIVMLYSASIGQGCISVFFFLRICKYGCIKVQVGRLQNQNHLILVKLWSAIYLSWLLFWRRAFCFLFGSQWCAEDLARSKVSFLVSDGTFYQLPSSTKDPPPSSPGVWIFLDIGVVIKRRRFIGVSSI